MSAEGSSYRRLSLWHDTAPGSLMPRTPLRGNVGVDVAIVGAGFTGLWTARSLAAAEPTLRIAVLEREIAGFGASGRNGGWVSSAFSATKSRVAAEYGRDAAIAMQRAMFATVDEVGTACDAEGIDAHYCKGGSLTVAVDAPQAERIAGMLEEDRSFGFGEEDSSWLDAEATRARLDVAGAVGAMFTPHCARVHPSRLARGLADAVERRGVALFERTPVVGTDDRVLITPHGRLRADVVVWATEGYGGRTAPRGRDVAPVYTYMVATEPMPSAFWDEVGWSGYECVGDGPRLYLYAQRTDDDRIAIGGGALRYPFASRARPSMDHAPTVFRQIARILVRRWPAAAGARLTHAWGGPCGMSRDWFPSVGVDRTRGFAWGGGYVGDGVAASNLAGRTLADLILDRDTDLVRLPWVGHRWPRWEPEPLRWLGVRSGIGLARVADLVESRSGRVPHLLDVAMDRLAGP